MDKKKVVAFSRQVPKVEDLYPEQLNEYIITKWRRFQNALDFEADYLVVAFPEVLGDDYVELVINLGKISQSGKGLYIAKPSSFLRETGEVEVSGTPQEESAVERLVEGWAAFEQGHVIHLLRTGAYEPQFRVGVTHCNLLLDEERDAVELYPGPPSADDGQRICRKCQKELARREAEFSL